MKQFVILEEGDFCISLPGARKTIIVQNKEVYISDTNSYPGDVGNAHQSSIIAISVSLSRQ